MRGFPGGAVVAVLVPAAGLWVAPAAPLPLTLRYRLETGDRFVYRQTLTREAEGQGSLSVVQAEWTNEVLVLARSRQGAVVGVQRRRRSAELVRGRGDGRFAGRGFAEQLARQPEVVTGANVFDDRGQALLALSVEREWPSDLLPFVQEIEALPPEAVAPGQGFRGTHPLGLEFRAEDREEVGGEACLRLRGSLPRDQVVLRLWFGTESRILRRLELEGSYPVIGGEIREKLRLELVEHHRGERPDAWLDAPERREGVLAALLIADGLPVEPARLFALLAVEDAGVQRAALRLLWRRRLPVAMGAVAPLLASADPRVRTLATLLHRPPPPEARPLPEPGLSSVAAAVRGGGTVPNWRCEADPSWAQRALDEQRLPPEPPGARMRAMSSGRWRGQPYVLHVPDAYRGDQPTPLLVYLSGGPGRALLGWATAAEAVSPTGYLVVFPQASGMWWTDESEELVRLLVDEVLDRFNVDTNRVYLAGFSNGGTGTYFYAARWADRLAAAVSLEGAGPYVEFGLPLPSPGGVGRLPFLFVHGDRDDIIAVDHSRRSVDLLKRENRDARVELYVLPGRSHDVMLGTDDGLSLAFLERQERDPFPREVAFTLDDLRAPRRYWLEVLEKKRGLARVEGRITDDGTVTVTTKGVRRLRLLLRRELLPETPELRVLVDGREAFRGAPVEDCTLLQRSWHDAQDPFRAHSIELPLEASR